jgi:glycosyltransferase involved in cell wall biosynthesis
LLAGLKRRVLRQPAPPAFSDVGGTGRPPGMKSALLVYVSRAFATEGEEALLTHQNILCCRTMAEVMGELGFAVDVISKWDRSFLPQRNYDLIVSERLDWYGVARLFPPQATQVFVATSLCHTLHNRNVRRRHERLAERGRAPIQIRRVYGETMPAVRAANAVVGVGNSFTMGTWSEVYEGPIHAFDNFAFPGTRTVAGEKDFESARRRFLFFASRSQMQKGLDLLLEIFPKHPELELFVCSQFAQEPDFCAVYDRELFRTPNVHAVGMVPVNGEQFYELARSCAHAIHPSCSDGQAGAVVQCMGAGLVPVVSRETGIDVDGFGVQFADDSLEEIERVILDLAARPPAWHEAQAGLARRAAEQQFSLDAFEARWREILTEILEAGPRA